MSTKKSVYNRPIRSAGRAVKLEELQNMCPRCKKLLPQGYAWIYCGDCRPKIRAYYLLNRRL